MKVLFKDVRQTEWQDGGQHRLRAEVAVLVPDCESGDVRGLLPEAFLMVRMGQWNFEGWLTETTAWHALTKDPCTDRNDEAAFIRHAIRTLDSLDLAVAVAA